MLLLIIMPHHTQSETAMPDGTRAGGIDRTRVILLSISTITTIIFYLVLFIIILLMLLLIIIPDNTQSETAIPDGTRAGGIDNTTAIPFIFNDFDDILLGRCSQ